MRSADAALQELLLSNNPILKTNNLIFPRLEINIKHIKGREQQPNLDKDVASLDSTYYLSTFDHKTPPLVSRLKKVMAAAEYYASLNRPAELPPAPGPANMYQPQQQQQPFFQQAPPQPHPPQNYNAPAYANTPPPQNHNVPTYANTPPPQNYNAPVYANTPPPPYSSYSLQSPPNQKLGPYAPQSKITPYPTTPPPSQQFTPPPQKNENLDAPLQPIRSHSQPARVHFADEGSDGSTDLGSDSDSDASARRRRHRRQRSRDHSRRRSGDRDYYDLDYSDRERGHRHKSHRKDHKDRDTFLGAGAGTIIGDAIFPGLGTAAGLLLGGYGGRKYAERSRSEGPSHHKRRDDYRDDRY